MRWPISNSTPSIWHSTRPGASPACRGLLPRLAARAAEEALHFTLLNEHLQALSHHYGDFDAHDGLWAMVERTAGDVTARMALVPRTLEARGLDATPPMQARLAKAGDARAVEILAIILRDEIGHVAVGNRWYRWLCERDGHDPLAHYARLAVDCGAPRLRPPSTCRRGATPDSAPPNRPRSTAAERRAAALIRRAWPWNVRWNARSQPSRRRHYTAAILSSGHEP